MSELISLPPDLPGGLAPFQMVPRVVTEAFRVLLNTKHLYQHVAISSDAVGKRLTPTLQRMFVSQQDFEYQLAKTMHPLFGYWYPAWQSGQNAPVLPREVMIFELPTTVKAFCERCEEAQPFNPAPPSLGFPYVKMRRENEQVFSIPYLCQGCKDFRLTFMVMRRDFKLTLTGRSVIEHVQVPPYIAKDVARYYSGAVIAYNCNQVLPALFMLRTLIEQHMRSRLAPAEYENAIELCEAYQRALDDAFKEQFPSLPDIYGKLSDALHEAQENENLFESEIERIRRHLEALRVWERNVERKS